MNPVILAAGKGERYKGDTIKPLMVVENRPVLLDALCTLDTMRFAADETYVAVNKDNRSAIRRAVGSGAINLVTQTDLTGPATAVKAVYETNPKLDELLVIQADDATWLDPIIPSFTLFHSRQNPIASMALLASGDPETHTNTYQVTDGLISSHRPGLPTQMHDRQGCNAGVYIVRRESYMAAYEAVGPPQNDDVGLPAIIKHMIDTGLSVGGPVYDTPWKSANTTHGLDIARALSRSLNHRQNIASHSHGNYMYAG